MDEALPTEESFYSEELTDSESEEEEEGPFERIERKMAQIAYRKMN